jgi:conjugal transfer mating pair stabilization protein TraN
MDQKTMLFRCCTAYSLVLLIFANILQANVSLDDYVKKGKELGKTIEVNSLSPKEIDSITPKELRGQKFDGESALKQLESSAYVSTDSFPQMDPRVQSVLENLENSIDSIHLPEEEIHETTEKCIVETGLESFTLHHLLNVSINHKKKESYVLKICKGHSRKEKSDTPESDKRQENRKFATDPTIKTYSVKIKKKGIGHRDVVVSKWFHINNASSCNCFEEKEVTTTPDKYEEIDSWQLQTPELLDHIDCTLIDTENGAPETRLIDGREVFRPYWTKTQHIQCIKKKSDSCDSIKVKTCVLTYEKCIYKSKNQCLTKELMFKCTTKKNYSYDFKGVYGMNSQLWDTEYLPNKEFSDMSTKLAVFDEMKKELQNAGSIDVHTVQIFKGEKNQCSKSIAEDLMYDCCIDMDGLSTKLKLSKCTSNEIALAESRKKGLTHYIGVKEEKFLDLWVSHKEHVFCVFPSKLSRVFQEAARDQLQIDWGTPEKPNCKGLTQEEIKKLNFSKLDLSEAFELPKVPDHQEKVEKIEQRLKQRLEAM